MPLKLLNTLSHAVEPLVPGDPARVTFYTCGPTVYDDAHIGNFRSFLAADLLRRFIESGLCELDDGAGGVHRGPREVVQVMNITDVGHMTEDDVADGGGEDKMAVAEQRLARAKQEAKKSGTQHEAADVDPSDPRAIAAFYAQRFVRDGLAVGLRVAQDARTDPTLMPRASEHVEAMKRQIETLAGNGLAYVAGEVGSRAVYFDVGAYSKQGVGYGQLSGNTLERLRAGAGGRVDDTDQQAKRHPADFLLWKEDAKHLMRWPGPTLDGASIGEGYPGWHIECSAMALGRLDPDGARKEIDLHSGGEDNIFPHHECEIAQARGVTGHERFARHWFHARFLLIEGEKMSKSKGRFFTVRELIDQGHDPAAVRLELIKTHYRANANFSLQGLKDSARMVARWRKVAAGVGKPASIESLGRPHAEVARRFADALHDDLNVAGALGVLNQWVGTLGEPTPADAGLMRALDAVLGVLDLEQSAVADTEIGVFLPGAEPSDAVVAKLNERAEARSAKDYATSDAIRDELLAMGYAIKDVAGGKVEVSPAGVSG